MKSPLFQMSLEARWSGSWVMASASSGVYCGNVRRSLTEFSSRSKRSHCSHELFHGVARFRVDE